MEVSILEKDGEKDRTTSSTIDLKIYDWMYTFSFVYLFYVVYPKRYSCNLNIFVNLCTKDNMLSSRDIVSTLNYRRKMNAKLYNAIIV